MTDDGWQGAWNIPGKEPPVDDGPREIDWPACPVVPLGHLKGVFFFFSACGEEREFKARELQRRDGLADLFDGRLAWLYENFRQDDGKLAAEAAGQALMRRCVGAGIFNPDAARRGPGVWRQGDQVVVHSGNRVLWAGEWRRAGFIEGGVIYTLAEATRPPAEPASGADCQAILDALRLWQWDDDGADELVLGAMVVGCLGAAVEWKTHIFVRAQLGAGKTALAEYYALITGARDPASNITPASFYQQFTGEARSVVIDEAEAGEHDDRMAEVVKVIRLGSGRAGGKVSRGSADGRVRSYQINCQAFMVGILHPPFKPADLSRFAIFKLRPLPTGEQAIDAKDKVTRALARAGAAGAALQARAIREWRRYEATVAIYRRLALRDGIEPRSADSIAALLAGYDVAMREDLPGESEAEGRIDRFAYLVQRADERADNSDAEQCLSQTLGSPVQDAWQHGERKTVGERIIDAQIMNAPREEINRQLGRLGLRLEYTTGADRQLLCLVVANKHVGLGAIFDGTRWAGGVHAQALLDLPGAAKWGTAYFAGDRQRGVAIPLDRLPRPEHDTDARAAEAAAERLANELEGNK